ncbi:hypothetical protein C672_0564 [[Clostridium] bifermentans ATCC 638]|uniref:Uncharacterized protein n=1 Tax=Paraclostridium bifermentans ATCC 638 = DSM 14991 TaxID=1233171 RepID=T4VTE4_PARBF|nr:hypothetical protein [Paraclostridium bifermentans]EQK44036.1 hypothetical protein C672_0564 [[Clostridium] bifermentans ATCC 638] [Paraclostridium bifermentans ATCC 638 = DSM 14991]RIZ58559.1 hypothetical protein CHH45_10640 [Paraclostridium bifermentans]UAG19776.1 hypothetical protein KXZ80_16565 [Paraclostridium bifermentans]
MKKSLVGALALGLVIGAGTMGVTIFANEKDVATQTFSNGVTPAVSNVDQNDFNQVNTQFKELSQETNQIEKLDGTQYKNSNSDSNSNYRNCCSYGNYGNGSIN